jgi:hypothetical protein
MMGFRRAPKFTPGDTWHGWTVLELKVDGPRASDRLWIIQCGCGYQARRWESELNGRGSACITCGHAARKAGKE